MVSFYIYDLAFLVVFSLIVIIFLYRNRKKLQRQGLLYLYRTKVGIRFIEWTAKKFPKTLRVMQYVIVFSGYLLMISMIYLIFKFSFFYIFSQNAAEQLKVPVIIPLVPYLPELFGLDFLPPFFFTYWIIIIAFIAIPHEFAHGIFSRFNKIRIHSTGFGFLGPFLAAFVEPDEKKMEKAKKFSQLTILAAGTFANIVFSIISGIALILFFNSFFIPSGINYLNVYPNKMINISEIDFINGIPFSEGIKNIDLDKNNKLVEIEIDSKKYYTSNFALNLTLRKNLNKLIVLEDSPSFKSRLLGNPLLDKSKTKIQGAIKEIDGKPIKSVSDLADILKDHSPGDEIKIKILKKDPKFKNPFSNLYTGKEEEISLTLGERDGRAYMGILLIPNGERKSLSGLFLSLSKKFKDPQIYYTSLIGDFGIFIYDLIWWFMLISISVALVNMLPLGIFDGGRFFMLSVWALTGKRKLGEKAFKISTYFILLLIVAMMIRWLLIFI